MRNKIFAGMILVCLSTPTPVFAASNRVAAPAPPRIYYAAEALLNVPPSWNVGETKIAIGLKDQTKSVSSKVKALVMGLFYGEQQAANKGVGALDTYILDHNYPSLYKRSEAKTCLAQAHKIGIYYYSENPLLNQIMPDSNWKLPKGSHNDMPGLRPRGQIFVLPVESRGETTLSHVTIIGEKAYFFMGVCEGVFSNPNSSSTNPSDSTGAGGDSQKTKSVKMPKIIGWVDGQVSWKLAAHGYKFSVAMPTSTGFAPLNSCLMSKKNLVLRQTPVAGSSVVNTPLTVVRMWVDCG